VFVLSFYKDSKINNSIKDKGLSKDMKRVTNLVQHQKVKVLKKLREKALLRTKARLAENKIDIEELSEEELEIIIKDEEDKLLDDIKTKSIFALAAMFGLSVF